MTFVLHLNPANVDDERLRDAVRMLRDGLVVAFPTDTLYGLAVDPRNVDAVRRLYELKGRAATAALPLIAADLEQAELAAVLNATARRLAECWWPGSLTIVSEARPAVSPETLAGGRTVGVRVPDHAVARALARALGFCVTATSANRSGKPAASRADEVMTALPHVDCIIDGGVVRGGAPSTIVEVAGTDVHLVRAGAIAWDRVLKSVG